MRRFEQVLAANKVTKDIHHLSLEMHKDESTGSRNALGFIAFPGRTVHEKLYFQILQRKIAPEKKVRMQGTRPIAHTMSQIKVREDFPCIGFQWTRLW